MTLAPHLSPPRSTDSVYRLGQAAPTYIRTYGLTKNLQDRTHLLALHNAREKNAKFRPDPQENP